MVDTASAAIKWDKTWRNLWPSSGIWFMMSGEVKMGSKYCQVAWQASQLSTTSCSLFSVSSHSSASFSRGPMKGDALIDCVFTIWSSRMACITCIVRVNQRLLSPLLPEKLGICAWWRCAHRTGQEQLLPHVSSLQLCHMPAPCCRLRKRLCMQRRLT